MRTVFTEWFASTASIIDLLGLLKASGLTFSLSHEEAGFLNAIYRSRYPPDAGLLPHGEPTQNDASKALALVRRVLDEGKKTLLTGL